MTELKKDPFNEGGNLPECVWPYPGRRKRILGPNIGIKREAKAARNSSSNAKPKRNEDIRWRYIINNIMTNRNRMPKRNEKGDYH